MQKNTKQIVGISAVVLVLLIAAFTATWLLSRPQTAEGQKTITVDIVLADGTTETLTIETDEEYLRGVLEQEGLISGTESEFGLFVTTVNGTTVDEANQEWWSFSKNGEALMTGVGETPVADGDHFEITLTVGW